VLTRVADAIRSTRAEAAVPLPEPRFVAGSGQSDVSAVVVERLVPAQIVAEGYYVMVNTPDRADITYDRGSDSIRIDWPDGHTANQAERARVVFDKITQANGVDY
jgi:hypothetical protein